MSSQPVSRRRTYARRFLAVVVFVGVGVALVCWLRPARHTGPTYEAFLRVKDGMTQAEVEQVLGMPPGDYSTRPTNFLCASTTSSPMPKEMRYHRSWAGNDLLVDVYFDQNGRVVRAESWGNLREATWQERARRWLQQLF